MTISTGHFKERVNKSSKNKLLVSTDIFSYIECTSTVVFHATDFVHSIVTGKIDTFGRDRMAYEVGQLRATFDKCAAGTCDFARAERTQPKKKIKRKMDPDVFVRLQEENYGTCENPGSSYQKLKTRNLTHWCEWTDVYLHRNFDL